MIKKALLLINLAAFVFVTVVAIAYSAHAAPASTDTILRWLPPGTVEIRCVNGPVNFGKYNRTKPLDPRSISLLEFMQSVAIGDISEFLLEKGRTTAGILKDKIIFTSIRGSQVLELTNMETDCWSDVDIVEFTEPIKEQLTADLLSRSLKHSMMGANQVWEIPSRVQPRNLRLYLTIPDDHTVIVSSSTNPAILLATLQRMNARASACVVPASHLGWKYLDRQSNYWFFNAYPAVNKNHGSSAQPQVLDDFAKSALAVVAQYRPAKTPTIQFAYLSNSSRALALLKARLDVNFVTPRVRFTPRSNMVVQFDYQPAASGIQDFSVFCAALYSMVGHEVH